MTDGLLKWASFYTRGHDCIKPVTDLTKCWADGLAFCALIYNWFPEKIPITELKVDTDEDKIKNCELAFQVAFEEAGINKYLDGEDMISYQDKKSISLYLSEVYAVLHDKPTKFTPSEEWQREYERKMIMEKRAVMEANARGEAFASRGSSAALRWIASQQGSTPPTTPAATPVAISPSTTPLKASTNTVVRGGLTPKSGTGSLWANRTGTNPTATPAKDEEPLSLTDPTPRTSKIISNLGSLTDEKKETTEEKDNVQAPRGASGASLVAKKGTGGLWANRLASQNIPTEETTDVGGTVARHSPGTMRIKPSEKEQEKGRTEEPTIDKNATPPAPTSTPAASNLAVPSTSSTPAPTAVSSQDTSTDATPPAPTATPAVSNQVTSTGPSASSTPAPSATPPASAAPPGTSATAERGVSFKSRGPAATPSSTATTPIRTPNPAPVSTPAASTPAATTPAATIPAATTPAPTTPATTTPAPTTPAPTTPAPTTPAPTTPAPTTPAPTTPAPTTPAPTTPAFSTPTSKIPAPTATVPTTPATTTPATTPAPISAPSTSLSGEGINYSISGRGKGGGTVGNMVIFTVSLTINGETVEAAKEDLEVVIEHPGQDLKHTVMGGKGGAFHVGFSPKEPGQYWVDFVFKGMWVSPPFMLPIKNSAGHVPDFPYEGKLRRLRAKSPIVVPEPHERQEPPPQQKTSETPQKKLETPQKSTETPPKKQEIPPKSTETPQKKQEIPPKSTETTQRRPPSVELPKRVAFPPNCTASGPGLTSLTDIEEGRFTITARDSEGNIITDTTEFSVSIFPASIVATVSNNGDGTYSCVYGPLDSGTYQIEVSTQGKAIKGGPWTVIVNEVVASAQFTEITILFQVINKKGENLARGGDASAFVLDCKGGKISHLQDSGLEDGRYHFDYEAVPGTNFINIVSNENGKSIDGFPLTWTV